MTNFETIQAVIAANRAIQMEARKWNNRAGEIVFPVMTNEEWKLWLGSRLKGAISCATISNLDLLRLPALDVGLVNLTREMNPDSIIVLGKVVPVEYREPYCDTPRLPQVTLGDEFISSNCWNELPNEGVKLPGGRAVHIVLKSSTSWSALAEGSDIVALKQSMKSRLNEGQWSRWIDRPVIAVPTEITDKTVLSDIITVVYGRCVMTGEDLFAFGTLTASRSWSSDSIIWKTEWFRVRMQAETAFNNAQVELEKAKVKARDRREIENILSEAEKVQNHVRSLYDTYASCGIESSLLDKLYSFYFASIPETKEECVEWITNANAVVAEVEVTLARRLHNPQVAQSIPKQSVKLSVSLEALASKWGARNKK